MDAKEIMRRGGSLLDEVDVSIVVATYNPSREKLLRTLDSIIIQKNIIYEIIIADDGSRESISAVVYDYFFEKRFSNYKLIENKVNKGTVHNIYSGISVAKGKYIKLISPGDMLYKNDTLQNWIGFMEDNNLEWSFSEAINYQHYNDKIIPVVAETHPRDVSVYKDGSLMDKRWNYCVLGDIAIGATMICCRKIQEEYCKQILNKVIYAEDNIWRMMMFDGIVGGYYPEYTILYEYGEGVSTSQNTAWKVRLQKDWKETNKILMERTNLDNFQTSMKNAIITNQGKSKIRKIFIKGNLKRKIVSKKRKSIDFLP